MTPQQQIKAIVIVRAIEQGHTPLETDTSILTPEVIEAAYDELCDSDIVQEILSELREGEVETNIQPDYSRHYETQSVAAQCPDGRWIGWTYWYGGGKHGCPEEIDWISYAYYLNCKEEEKLVTVRTFTKVECPAS